MSINNITLQGRIAYISGGYSECDGEPKMSVKMTVAVDRQTKEKQTDFISCRAYGKTAEFIDKYFRKGQEIALCGKLHTYSYEKNKEKRSGYCVDIREVSFCGPKHEGEKIDAGQIQDDADDDFEEIGDEEDFPF